MLEFSGLKVGHVSDLQHKTGLSVFLFDQPVRCGRWLCGAAPASRDCDLLAPEAMVETIDAIMLTGGSAFGLDAAGGVMQWLKEQQRGWPTYFARVPIVPGAAIYDFHSSHPTPPSAMDAYEACKNASYYFNQHGTVGAGTGASVGKLLAHASPMAGGLGYAKLTTESGLEVIAFAVVNCAGDVYAAEKIIAGARLPDGEYADTYAQLLQGKHAASFIKASHTNTTLVVTVTNAKFNKAQLTRLARMASNGMARAIRPVFTTFDGDVVFSVSLGTLEAEEMIVGTLFAEATRLAIINAVI